MSKAQQILRDLEDDEPFFVLRGKDLLVVPTLTEYRRLAQLFTNDIHFDVNLKSVVNEFIKYRDGRGRHRMKFPD